ADPRRRQPLPRSRSLHAQRRRLVGPLPGAGRPARGAGAATRVRGRAQGPMPSRERTAGRRGLRGAAMKRAQAMALAEDAAPTDELARLAASALLVKLAASALRFLAACSVGFAGLLLLALVLSSFERTGNEPAAQTSASA